MCFRKLYLGFLSFLVFSCSGNKLVVVILIVSDSNPLLINTSISCSEDTLLFYSALALLLVQSNLSFVINEMFSLNN